MKVNILLLLLAQAFNRAPFTVKDASLALSQKQHTRDLPIIDLELVASDPGFRCFEVKRLSNDIKRLYSMGRLKRRRQERILKTKDGRAYGSGFEYSYSISMQGLKWIQYWDAGGKRRRMDHEGRIALDLIDWDNPQIQMLFVILRVRGIRIPPEIEHLIQMQKVR